MHPSKIHIGTFEGEALRRSGRIEAERSSIIRDLASALAMAFFCGSVATILLFVLLPDLPA